VRVCAVSVGHMVVGAGVRRSMPKSARRSVPPDEQPHKRVGVLVYGLVRSIAMLEVTAPALEEQIFRPLAPHALAFGHVYCMRPLCDPSVTETRLRNITIAAGVRLVSLSIQSEFPSPSLPLRAQPFGCRGGRFEDESIGSRFGFNVRIQEDDPGQHQLWTKYYAGLASLRNAMHASELAVPPVSSLLLARVDVQFQAPGAADFWLNKPWRHEGRLFIPTFQNHGGFNDRFSYGHAATMRRYIEARFHRMAPRLGHLLPPEKQELEALDEGKKYQFTWVQAGQKE